MKRRLVDSLVIFFLSLSLSYMAWAIPWEKWIFSTTQAGSYGEGTIITVDPIDFLGSTQDNTSEKLAQDLEEVTSRHNIALYVTIVGVGRPETVVMDPNNVLDWMPADPQKNTVYPFSGTYVEKIGCEHVLGSFISGNYMCGHAIEKDSTIQSSQIQYARLWDSQLPIIYGSYAVTTTDSQILQEIKESFEKNLSVTVTTSQTRTLFSFLKKEPVFIFGTAILFAGMLVLIFFFFMWFFMRTDSLKMLWNCGASRKVLLGKYVKEAFIKTSIPSVAGALLASIVPPVISMSPTPVSSIDVFVWGWVLSWFMSAFLYISVNAVSMSVVMRRWENE